MTILLHFSRKTYVLIIIGIASETVINVKKKKKKKKHTFFCRNMKEKDLILNNMFVLSSDLNIELESLSNY